MSLVNAAYRDALTWPTRLSGHSKNRFSCPCWEQSLSNWAWPGQEDRVYAELARDPVYRQLFASSFPDEHSPANRSNIVKALASFLRSIVSFRSPFDRYRFDGDASALSAAAHRG